MTIVESAASIAAVVSNKVKSRQAVMERFGVDPADIKTYQEEGAVCVKGAFKEWVPRLMAAHDRLQDKLESQAEETPNGKSAKIENEDGYPPLTYSIGKNGHFGIRNAVFADPDFRAWMTESPAADIMGQVLGAKTLQFWWDQSFCKTEDAAVGGATPWHTDAGSFSFLGEMLPSFWIAGTDVGPGNAPILTAVGSHKDRRLFRPVFGKEHVKQMPENYAELDEITKVVEDPNTEIKTWTVEAGDCLIIHPRTYHASSEPHADAGRRIALTSRWLGDDIRWKKTEMTFDYPDDKRFDNIVQDQAPPEDSFPVIWRAVEPEGRVSA